MPRCFACSGLALVVAAGACVPGKSADDTVAGTYAVSGELVVHPADGAEARSAIADEIVTVRLTSRYDQGASYDIAVRGCRLQAHGQPSVAGIPEQSCNLLGIEAGTDSRVTGHVLQKKAEMELLVQGSMSRDGGTSGWFSYFVHGLPKR